ncbi:hypothetical protein NQ071_25035, partial [Escherichia coli]|nr:hypothetical protein [Escherichia coli]
ADAEHMYMYYICRCLAYGYVIPFPASLSFLEDPKKGKVGSGLAKHEEGRRRYGRKEFKAKGRRERNGPL